jgi:acyl-CoA thioesterase
MLSPQEHITTVEMKLNFLAPAKLGALRTRAKILHKGKRIAVGDAEVLDESGKLIAKGTATYMILANNASQA